MGGGGVGSVLGSIVGDAILPGIGGVIGGALGGAGGAAVTGGNVGTSALLGGLGGAANAFGGDAIDALTGDTEYGGQSLAGSVFGTGGDQSLLSNNGLGSPLGDIFGSGSNAASNAASGSLNTAAAGAVPSDAGSQINWNNDLTTGSSSPGASTLAKLVGASNGNNNNSSSGLLGNNPLASLGILANGLSSYQTGQANQKSLAAQQAAQNQFNTNAYNSISNFTPLNRQVVSPQTVGNLNNYGQAGYTGWNGQGGNQLFYNNVNPASYQLPAMKAGGKVNYASGGASQGTTDPTQQYYQSILQNLMNPSQGQQARAPQPQTRQLPNQGPSLASILSNMEQNSKAQMAVTPAMANNPMTYNLNSQIYPEARQSTQIEAALNGNPYAKGGMVKSPKVKGLQISKTTQLTLPTNALSSGPGSQGLNPGIQPSQMPQPAQAQGIEGLPQGLAGGGLPRIMDKQQRPMGMPMQPMPNRIPAKTSGMMPTRMNPNNPNLNLSPLRMMANGGHLNGSADGQADTIPAKLSDGEYVLPSDVISSLGNGNNDAGAKVADNMVKNIRIHKSVNPPNVKGAKGKLPPKAKPIVEYIKHRKVKK